MMAANNTQHDWRSESVFTPEQQQFFNRIVVTVILVGLGIWIGSLIFNGDAAPGYATNIYTEVLSVAVTVGILDYLSRRRDDQRKVDDLKEQLVRDASSLSNEIAKDAVHQIKKHGWLHGEDGLLKGAHLMRANLAGAHLWRANLEGAYLLSAHLEGANFEGAHLAGAHLSYAQLAGANLYDANLEGANLSFAHLQGADLQGAHLERAFLGNANLKGASLRGIHLEKAFLGNASLEGADLRHANLAGADLGGTKFDETTTLPDSSKWVADRDMREFTDPEQWKVEHP